MNRSRVFVITLFVGSMFWGLGYSLSDYLAGEHGRKTAQNRQQKPVPLSGDLLALQQQLAQNPDDAELRIQLARATYQEAKAKRNAQLVMEAVQQYARVIQKDPNNQLALQELAALCFEQRIYDKAEEYLRRLLTIDPGNIQARTDLGLVLVQAGNAKDALPLLEGIIRDNPELFPPRFALALAHRVAGDFTSSREAAAAARAYAPNDDARARIDRFVQSIADSETQSKSTDALEVFFREHQIIGPKLVSFSFDPSDTARVRVRQFPVEQMPPIAKQVFLGKVQAVLRTHEAASTVLIIDADDGRELLRIAETE